MPKRGRRKSFTRKRRVKADWVYRPMIVDSDNSFPSMGGWQCDTDTFDITNGPDQGRMLILYDSHNFMASLTNLEVFDAFTPTALAQDATLPAAARTSGTRMPTVKAVEGHVFMVPTAWTLGSRFMAKARLGWYEQDETIGQVLLDAAWTVFTTSSRLVCEQANDTTTHIREYTMSAAARENATTPVYHWRILWKGARRAPSERHCLGLWIEAPNAAAWCNSTFRCFSQIRSLIARGDNV